MSAITASNNLDFGPSDIQGRLSRNKAASSLVSGWGRIETISLVNYSRTPILHLDHTLFYQNRPGLFWVLANTPSSLACSHKGSVKTNWRSVALGSPAEPPELMTRATSQPCTPASFVSKNLLAELTTYILKNGHGKQKTLRRFSSRLGDLVANL